jgi:hypothetical protein
VFEFVHAYVPCEGSLFTPPEMNAYQQRCACVCEVISVQM